jgi:hypothetical protein
MGIGRGQTPKPLFKKFRLVPVEEDSVQQAEQLIRNYDPTVRAMANSYNGMQEALYDKKTERTAVDRLALFNSNRARLLSLKNSAQAPDDSSPRQPEPRNDWVDIDETPKKYVSENDWVDLSAGLSLHPDPSEAVVKSYEDKKVQKRRLSREKPLSTPKEPRRSRRLVKAKPIQAGTGRVMNTPFTTQSRHWLTNAARQGRGRAKHSGVPMKKAARPIKVLRLY